MLMYNMISNYYIAQNSGEEDFGGKTNVYQYFIQPIPASPKQLRIWLMFKLL